MWRSCCPRLLPISKALLRLHLIAGYVVNVSSPFSQPQRVNKVKSRKGWKGTPHVRLVDADMQASPLNRGGKSERTHDKGKNVREPGDVLSELNPVKVKPAAGDRGEVVEPHHGRLSIAAG